MINNLKDSFENTESMKYYVCTRTYNHSCQEYAYVTHLGCIPNTLKKCKLTVLFLILKFMVGWRKSEASNLMLGHLKFLMKERES
jgi:hypothetical protein